MPTREHPQLRPHLAAAPEGRGGFVIWDPLRLSDRRIRVTHLEMTWLRWLDGRHSLDDIHAEVRARLSGTLDLEGYQFSQPAPGFIASRGESLFSPRLTNFLDVQMGAQVYAFAQMRVDRGFDPGQRPLRGRLDEYALRFTPWEDGRFSVQVGKFGTVVGSWVPRHGSWENPFITAPLVYEQLTGVWDAEAADSLAELLNWAHVKPRLPRGAPATDKGLRIPLLWGPSYTTGAAVSGEIGHWVYAAEVKNAGLASRPRVWGDDTFDFSHPTVSGRIAFRPSATWEFGASASRGAYLYDSAIVPAGRARGDYQQIVFGQDVSFAWHHLQVWAEVFEGRFTIPGVGDAGLFSYYVELRQKLTPQLAIAVRWNEQHYGEFTEPTGDRVRWSHPIRRLDLGPTYRFTAHTQLKVQYSLQHEEHGPREFSSLFATQFVLRF